MRCPSGIFGTKVLFVVVNLVIILFWARQIEVEASKERVERMNAEVQWWDGEIERLEELLVEVRFSLLLHCFSLCYSLFVNGMGKGANV